MLALFILFAVFGGVIILLVVFFSSTFGGLDFSTRKSVLRQIKTIIAPYNNRHLKIYDLGSAWGRAAIYLARALPACEIFGIDDSRFRVAISRLRGTLVPNVHFVRQDLFTTNLSHAGIVFVYLPQELMADLENKCQNELPSGSLVITNRVSFPSWQAEKKLGQLYVYVKK